MIRTLEELEEVDYENLTYGEFCGHDLDCEQYCPLYGEECNTSFVLSYSEQPMEPPCQCFDKRESMQEIYRDILSRRKQYEEQEDRQLELEKEKERRLQQRKQKLYRYRIRNYDELQLIKALKVQIKGYEHTLKNLNIVKVFAQARNNANEIFKRCDISCQDDILVDSFISAKEEVNSEISKCQQLIAEIKAKIKQKEKENK